MRDISSRDHHAAQVIPFKYRCFHTCIEWRMIPSNHFLYPSHLVQARAPLEDAVPQKGK